jgi:hypothetical protein
MKTSVKTVGLALMNFMFTTSAMAIPMEQHVQKVASHLKGVMVRSGQTDNADAPTVKMVTCPLTFRKATRPFSTRNKP